MNFRDRKWSLYRKNDETNGISIRSDVGRVQHSQVVTCLQCYSNSKLHVEKCSRKLCNVLFYTERPALWFITMNLLSQKTRIKALLAWSILTRMDQTWSCTATQPNTICTGAARMPELLTLWHFYNLVLFF